MTKSLLLELIQTCCSSGISTAIVVMCDSEEGRVFIRDGELIHAETREAEGEEALSIIASWEFSQFETQGFSTASEVTIFRPWAEVIETLKENIGISGLDERKEPTKVLVVDDSSMMRRAISDIISAQPDMEVAATAANGEDALKKMAGQKFDVITLDVNMPVMDGSTAIKHIMIKKPCPVVIISNTDRSAVGNIMDFLMLGAVDFVAKPVRGGNLALQADRIAGRIRTAAKAGSSVITRFKPPAVRPERDEEEGDIRPVDRLVVVLAGAGGHAEWFRLVCGLPKELDACVLVIQNMPPDFVEPLAEYTAARCAIDVRPLTGEAAVLSSSCYLSAADAPPGIFRRRDITVLSETDPIASINQEGGLDGFLTALSEHLPEPPAVLVLSGGGGRAFEGLSAVRNKGGRIAVENREACMVRSFPDEIVNRGLADEEIKADAMVDWIKRYAGEKGGKSAPVEDDDSGLDWLI